MMTNPVIPPAGLKKLLEEFAYSVLKSKPNDLYEYAADYFVALQKNKLEFSPQVSDNELQLTKEDQKNEDSREDHQDDVVHQKKVNSVSAFKDLMDENEDDLKPLQNQKDMREHESHDNMEEEVIVQTMKTTESSKKSENDLDDTQVDSSVPSQDLKTDDHVDSDKLENNGSKSESNEKLNIVDKTEEASSGLESEKAQENSSDQQEITKQTEDNDKLDCKNEAITDGSDSVPQFYSLNQKEDVEKEEDKKSDNDTEKSEFEHGKTPENGSESKNEIENNHAESESKSLPLSEVFERNENSSQMTEKLDEKKIEDEEVIQVNESHAVSSQPEDVAHGAKEAYNSSNEEEEIKETVLEAAQSLNESAPSEDHNNVQSSDKETTDSIKPSDDRLGGFFTPEGDTADELSDRNWEDATTGENTDEPESCEAKEDDEKEEADAQNHKEENENTDDNSDNEAKSAVSAGSHHDSNSPNDDRRGSSKEGGEQESSADDDNKKDLCEEAEHKDHAPHDVSECHDHDQHDKCEEDQKDESAFRELLNKFRNSISGIAKDDGHDETKCHEDHDHSTDEGKDKVKGDETETKPSEESHKEEEKSNQGGDSKEQEKSEGIENKDSEVDQEDSFKSNN